MAEMTVKWMYRDAGSFKGLAKLNPMRWSAPLSFPAAVNDLSVVQEEHPNRPIRLKIFDGVNNMDVELNSPKEAIDQLQCRLVRLPILIVPGFVCAGLRVESSVDCPDWEPSASHKGRRLWLDLPRLGFSSLVCKGLRSWETWEEDEEGQGQLRLKNLWLRHLTLKGPEEEEDGIQVKVIEGLDGVKCLDAGLLFASPTRIFGPVISRLCEVGYEEDVDLASCNFDWRFAPGALQRRVGYFDELVRMVESLDTRGTGVALLAHSMGNKTAQYFFEHAKAVKGQEWLDKHIRVWVASAAPLLGAPQAAKATLFGDRFGLDAFLSTSEALVMARSFSSSPWMFPIGAGARQTFSLRRQGLLQIKGLEVSVPGSSLAADDKVIQVAIEVRWGSGHGKDVVESGMANLDADGYVAFPDEENFMHFGGPAELPQNATIMVVLKERKVLKKAEEGMFSKMRKGFTGGLQMLGEVASGRSGLGVPRADTIIRPLEDVAGHMGEFVDVKLSVAKWRFGTESPSHIDCSPDRLLDTGLISFKARWLDYRMLRQEWLGSEAAAATLADETSASRPQLQDANSKATYDYIGITDLLKMEGCCGLADVWKKYYLDDAYFTDSKVEDCPPVQRVLSIHGANLVTDVGYAIRLHTCRFIPTIELRSRFVLDSEAKLMTADSSRMIRGGTIYEVPSSKSGAVSGDGVVPLNSMEHTLSWGEKIRVDLYRIEGAEHKVLLHGDRFSEYLLKEIDLVGDATWREDDAIEIGDSCEGLGHIRLFDAPAHTVIKDTVAALKAGSLVCPEGFCIVYAAKTKKYSMVYQGGRREAALLALNARASD